MKIKKRIKQYFYYDIIDGFYGNKYDLIKGKLYINAINNDGIMLTITNNKTLIISNSFLKISIYDKKN